jgi:hypothetical protein
MGFSACFPEMVSTLTVIDSAGALAANADKTVQMLRKSILEETKFLSRDAATFSS